MDECRGKVEVVLMGEERRRRLLSGEIGLFTSTKGREEQFRKSWCCKEGARQRLPDQESSLHQCSRASIIVQANS
jgi:hypothetical protein